MLTGVNRPGNKGILTLFKVTKVSNRETTKTPKPTKPHWRRKGYSNAMNELIPYRISNQ